MKVLFICLVLLVTASSAYSQPATTTAPMGKQDLLKRSKSQKVGAWLFLAGGGTMFVLGAKDKDETLGNSEDTRSTALIVGGLVCVSVSTVLFIASARNKRKAQAMAFDFKMESAPVLQQNGFANQSYPALSFRLKL